MFTTIISIIIHLLYFSYHSSSLFLTPMSCLCVLLAASPGRTPACYFYYYYYYHYYHHHNIYPYILFILSLTLIVLLVSCRRLSGSYSSMGLVFCLFIISFNKCYDYFHLLVCLIFSTNCVFFLWPLRVVLQHAVEEVVGLGRLLHLA